MIAVAHHCSIQKAAAELFVSQPSISKAISNLEAEMGIKIFNRNATGVTLTEDGFGFLRYAKQVIEQADLLLSHYQEGHNIRRVFSISSHHYAFVVNAFVNLIKEYDQSEYEFSLRESRTYDIIEDIKTARSEIGILYLSKYNRGVIESLIKANHLTYQYLFSAKVHVFLSREHPLAKRSSVTLEDLLPYPRFTYDQGTHNSFYFSEEPLSTERVSKNIVVTDRATLFNLLIGLHGYTLASGILSRDLNGDQIVSVPLETDEQMDFISVHAWGPTLSHLAERYLQILQDYIKEYRAKE